MKRHSTRLSQVHDDPEELEATAAIEAQAGEIHLASDDYPEMGSILHDRPDPGALIRVVGSRKTAADTYGRPDDPRDGEYNGGGQDTGMYWREPAQQAWVDEHLGPQEEAPPPPWGDSDVPPVLARLAQIEEARHFFGTPRQETVPAFRHAGTTINGTQIDDHGDAPGHGTVPRATDPNSYDTRSTEGNGDPKWSDAPPEEKRHNNGATVGMYPEGMSGGDGPGLPIGAVVAHQYDIPSGYQLEQHLMQEHGASAPDLSALRVRAGGTYPEELERAHARVSGGRPLDDWRGETVLGHGRLMTADEMTGHLGHEHGLWLGGSNSPYELQRQHEWQHRDNEFVPGEHHGRALGDYVDAPHEREPDTDTAATYHPHNGPIDPVFGSKHVPWTGQEREQLHDWEAAPSAGWGDFVNRMHFTNKTPADEETPGAVEQLQAEGAWDGDYSDYDPEKRYEDFDAGHWTGAPGGRPEHAGRPMEMVQWDENHTRWAEDAEPGHHRSGEQGRFYHTLSAREPDPERFTPYKSPRTPMGLFKDEQQWDDEPEELHPFEHPDWVPVADEWDHKEQPSGWVHHTLSTRHEAVATPDEEAWRWHMQQHHGWTPTHIEIAQARGNRLDDLHAGLHAAGVGNHEHTRPITDAYGIWKRRETLNNMFGPDFRRLPQDRQNRYARPERGGASGEDPMIGIIRSAPAHPESSPDDWAQNDPDRFRRRMNALDPQDEFGPEYEPGTGFPADHSHGGAMPEDPEHAVQNSASPDWEAMHDRMPRRHLSAFDAPHPHDEDTDSLDAGPSEGDGGFPEEHDDLDAPDAGENGDAPVPPEEWPMAGASITEGGPARTQGRHDGNRGRKFPPPPPMPAPAPGAEGDGAPGEESPDGAEGDGKGQKITLEVKAHLDAFVAAASSREFRFEFTAAWPDVVAKAKRIRAEGHVQITHASAGMIIGNVRGDHDTYESGIQRPLGKPQTIQHWACGCPWASFHQDKSLGTRYAGRPCSHVMALRFEAQSRGMFGRTVTPDESAPAWRPSEVTVKSWPPYEGEPHGGHWREYWRAPSASRTAAYVAPGDDDEWLRGHMEHQHGIQPWQWGTTSPSKVRKYHDMQHEVGSMDHQHNAPEGVAGETHWPDVFKPEQGFHVDEYGGVPVWQREDLGDKGRMKPFEPLRFSESSLSPARQAVAVLLAAGEDPGEIVALAQLAGITVTADQASAPWGAQNVSQHPPGKPYGATQPPDPDQSPASYGPLSGPDPDNWGGIESDNAMQMPLTNEASVRPVPGDVHWPSISGWNPAPHEDQESYPYSDRSSTAGPSTSISPRDPGGIRMEEALDPEDEYPFPHDVRPARYGGQQLRDHPEEARHFEHYEADPRRLREHLMIDHGYPHDQAPPGTSARWGDATRMHRDAHDQEAQRDMNPWRQPPAQPPPDAWTERDGFNWTPHPDGKIDPVFGNRAELKDEPEPALPSTTGEDEIEATAASDGTIGGGDAGSGGDIQAPADVASLGEFGASAMGDQARAEFPQAQQPSVVGQNPGMGSMDEPLMPDDQSIQTIGNQQWSGGGTDSDETAVPDGQPGGSIDDIVASFQRSAAAKQFAGGGPGAGGGQVADGDIAAAARAYLQKTADVLPQREADELIAEGKGQRARNLGLLKLEGTHYEEEAEDLAKRGISLDDYDDDVISV